MKKNIVIINEYAGSPEYGMTFRHYYLAKEFVKAGHSVTIITASYSHFLKKYPELQGKTYVTEEIDGIKYLWVKVIKYAKSFDKKRVLKWFQFMFRLFFVAQQIEGFPDVVLCSPTAPFSILPAYFLAKKFKAKLVFEVRDIWPLTLVDIGGFSSRHPLVILMRWFEKFALKKSDVIVSNLMNYSEHIHRLGIERDAEWISNGIDLDMTQNIVALDEQTDRQVPADKFIVGYTGKLGVSNAMNYLIDAAALLKETDDICFVIVGDGQEKEALMRSAEGLHNVVFIDSIDKNRVPSMIARFDVCYIGWQKKRIYRFGTSANKIFDYMLAGKPVLHSISGSADIVQLAQCGLTVEAEEPEQIAEAVRTFYTMSPEQRKLLGENGKRYVLEHFTYQKLAEKYMRIF